MSKKIPKVFISYSWDEESTIEVDTWNLAEKFRDNGIESIIDQDHGGDSPTPDNGWKKWMQENIEIADYIVIVCTESYYKKIKDKVEVCAGRGVKREWLLIDNQIYDNNQFTKYIPIYYKKDKTSYIPTIIKNDCTNYIIDNNKSIKILIEYLNGNSRRLSPVKHNTNMEKYKSKAEYHDIGNGINGGEKTEECKIINKREYDRIIVGDKSFMIETINVKSDKYNLNVAIYPITYYQYDLFCDDMKNGQKVNNYIRDIERRKILPVVNITWKDAIDFCDWLSKRTKKNQKYKLPDVDEWEFIAIENMSKNNIWCKQKMTSEIGTNLGTKGIFDFLGNIEEFCENKMRKGGSFKNDLNTILNIKREKKITNLPSQEIGFRVIQVNL